MAKVTNETVLERVDQLAGDRSQTEIMLTYHATTHRRYNDGTNGKPSTTKQATKTMAR